MKTTLSLILTTATIGSVAAKLSNAAFLAAVPAEIVFAAAASLAIVGITIADYARAIRPLTVKAPLARVALPTGPRTTAYGIRRRSAIVERVAA
ncbi:MAG: hypothetical protein HYV96_01480 [Opitutae bacterium]|nr:hypothetical protein [Opitutae bacterium]